MFLPSPGMNGHLENSWDGSAWKTLYLTGAGIRPIAPCAEQLDGRMGAAGEEGGPGHRHRPVLFPEESAVTESVGPAGASGLGDTRPSFAQLHQALWPHRNTRHWHEAWDSPQSRNRSACWRYDVVRDSPAAKITGSGVRTSRKSYYRHQDTPRVTLSNNENGRPEAHPTG